MMTSSAKLRGRMIGVATAALLIFTVQRASASVQIDFESIAGVPAATGFFSGTPVVPNSELSTQLQLSHGLTFTSNASYVVRIALGLGHATSGEFGIGGVNTDPVNPDYVHYNAPIEIYFTMPGSPGAPAVTSFVSIRGDQVADIHGSATLEAFDIANNSLGIDPEPDVNGGLTLSFSSPAIHWIRLTQTQNNIAFDDLSFEDLTPADVAAVPEASSVLIWIVGISLSVVTLRRRPRAATAST